MWKSVGAAATPDPPCGDGKRETLGVGWVHAVVQKTSEWLHINEQKKVAGGGEGEIKGKMFGGLTILREGYLPSLDPHPLPKKGNKMGWKEKGGGRMVGFHAEAGSSRPLVLGLFPW